VPTHDIVPTHLVVKAMRDNGYKNAAYAIAELMDNSIQAGATQVELLCGEEMIIRSQRSRMGISQIAVLDNGCGMNASVLRMALQFGNGTHLDAENQTGIGRFGMGLPNSSISQCRRVEVWSWQEGHENALYTYIDLDEIEDASLVEVPEPQLRNIPKIWLEVGQSFDQTGTLVVWSKIDRSMWRTAQTIIDNSDFLIGRMYRYFLHEQLVAIRYVSFDMNARIKAINEQFARPNDPLYLMPYTSCPTPYDETPMFQQWGDETVYLVQFRGQQHEVRISFAYAKEEAREGVHPGNRPYGKHAAKNVGVSIVRAGRELDLDTAWSNPSEPRDRWWGVEISFPPTLDDLFGVTNNKQSARNFSELAKVDIETLLEDGQTLGTARAVLEADEDPRWPLLEFAHHIRKNINVISGLLRAQTETPKPKRHDVPAPEAKATEVTRKRIEEGHHGESDKQEQQQPPEERKANITEELIDQGVTKKQAEELAATTVGRGLKYTFVEASLSGSAFFDVKSRGGAVLISLNTNHPAYGHLVEILEEDVEDVDLDTLKSRLIRARAGLRLLIMAWARYEDEQPDGKRRNDASDTRFDWGRLAREFLDGED